MTFREELHILVRECVEKAKVLKRPVDKKLLRFNDLVNLAIQYGEMGEVFQPAVARDALLTEVVNMCYKDSDFYTGDLPNYNWMTSCRYDER